MRMKYGWVVALLALTDPAFAQTYVEASAGTVEYSSPCYDGQRCNSSDETFSLAVGYRFNRFISLEAGWMELGTIDLSDAEFDLRSHSEVTAFYASALLHYEFNEHWSIGLGLGAARADVDFSATLRNQSFAGSGSSTEFMAKLAGRYSFTDHVSVGLSLGHIGGDLSDDTRMATLGLRFSF